MDSIEKLQSNLNSPVRQISLRCIDKFDIGLKEERSFQSEKSELWKQLEMFNKEPYVHVSSYDDFSFNKYNV